MTQSSQGKLKRLKWDYLLDCGQGVGEPQKMYKLGVIADLLGSLLLNGQGERTVIGTTVGKGVKRSLP